MLEAEERDLERLGGRPPIVDADLLNARGIRRYQVPYTDAGGTRHDLEVTYSDLHPYFQVSVRSNDVFRVHQAPFTGRLCLLHGQGAWDVADTAASVIAEQMPKLLADAAAADGGETPTSSPDRMPNVDPITNYYDPAVHTVMRIDGGWANVMETRSGRLRVALDAQSAQGALRGTVFEVQDEEGAVLRSADAALAALYVNDQLIDGRWVRLDSAPAEGSAEAVLSAAVDADRTLAAPAYERVGDQEVDLIGVVLEDDVRADLDSSTLVRGDSWLFVARVRTRARPPAKPQRGRVTEPSVKVSPPNLLRTDRAGPTDLRERVPSLRPLGAATIALIGLGGVGAPSAVEFAKAGAGRLRMIESDALSTGNGARWPLGFLSAGHPKLVALLSHLKQNWPYTDIELLPCRLGQPRESGDSVEERDAAPSDLDTLDKWLDGAALIYDATADRGVNYFLSELAKDRGIPYVVVSATEGGFGGMVARFDPRPETACWTCLMHHFEAGTLTPPPRDQNAATANTWPAGCIDPTFTGAGFDIAAIALAGVRLACATMCAGTDGSYPAATWDYARYEFRTADLALPGFAETFTIEPHPDCHPCANRRSS
ncbi:ThiF family adenylyltransferase [Iamia sp. SCSIO 61187]|uniref:ThiF family adenylyltransferase n=1 Tax=Iamia sp. SCSIO 61187 TaxID=2722752 RepID=UPI001C6376B9|nr:ThiF family adenylyltransferase [Iamia sp. SCSIO 61187]QYG94202.1 ThiF family adenylyltransferase [Iamia sp. SCSIO 61187]